MSIIGIFEYSAGLITHRTQEGCVNTQIFLDFMLEFASKIAEAGREAPQRGLLIMDNLAIHHSKKFDDLKEKLREVGIKGPVLACVLSSSELN